jgi:septal ring factor EnvC (AmiA/AmiB activator)
MYDDALYQLKAAQDRKNELAAENEKLHAQLAELQKQATILSAQLESHQRDAATQASKTFFLRSYFASWQRFIDRYPDLKVRWEAFLNADVLAVPYSVPLPENPTW